IAHEAAGQRQFLPRPEAHVPASRPGGPELRVEAGRQSYDHIVSTGATDGGDHGRLVIEARDVTDPHCGTRAKLETEEVLKRPGKTRTPVDGRNAIEINAVNQNPSTRWRVHFRQELDQRGLPRAVLPHDRHYRSRL